MRLCIVETAFGFVYVLCYTHFTEAASLAKLLPRKQRLAATDRLIDLLVYRLYGLATEEVGIVERER